MGNRISDKLSSLQYFGRLKVLENLRVVASDARYERSVLVPEGGTGSIAGHVRFLRAPDSTLRVTCNRSIMFHGQFETPCSSEANTHEFMLCS